MGAAPSDRAGRWASPPVQWGATGTARCRIYIRRACLSRARDDPSGSEGDLSSTCGAWGQTRRVRSDPPSRTTASGHSRTPRARTRPSGPTRTPPDRCAPSRHPHPAGLNWDRTVVTVVHTRGAMYGRLPKGGRTVNRREYEKGRGADASGEMTSQSPVWLLCRGESVYWEAAMSIA